MSETTSLKNQRTYYDLIVCQYGRGPTLPAGRLAKQTRSNDNESNPNGTLDRFACI
jgi:hypothetical protein